jgi:hypothetical protein
MAIYATEGRFGSGKTAFSVWFAHRLAEVRGGVPIWANFDLVGSSLVPGPLPLPLTRIDQLYACEGGVIVLDELQGTIHARRSNYNLEFMSWFDQCRKQDSDVICITQALHKIDVIVREMIDIAFSCEDRGNYCTRVTPIDMYAERERAAFIFDRTASFDLYDHRQRAWALLGEKDAQKQGGKGKPDETVTKLEQWRAMKGGD